MFVNNFAKQFKTSPIVRRGAHSIINLNAKLTENIIKFLYDCKDIKSFIFDKEVEDFAECFKHLDDEPSLDIKASWSTRPLKFLLKDRVVHASKPVKSNYIAYAKAEEGKGFLNVVVNNDGVIVNGVEVAGDEQLSLSFDGYGD